ncbi:hypothetical protein [Blattabacterium cuenoti]|uniref:hypothetical protein n=1 Tax=Blattabacterium cuenoti TaxID=1653831 RepID=UPI00163B7744|nr:hypothetical protein [Blattabacterium cuenoti]
MKKKIYQIIKKHIALFKKQNSNNRKLIFLSKDLDIIEYIKDEYHCLFKKINTKFFTIEKFLELISKKKKLDQFHLFFYFISILKKDHFDKNELVKFIRLTPKILNDFQYIDFNMMNIHHVFHSIISTEKIKQWNSNFFDQKKILFWKKMNQYYHILQSKLLEKGLTYQGLMYKKSIDYLDNFLSHNLNVELIFFFEKI